MEIYILCIYNPKLFDVEPLFARDLDFPRSVVSSIPCSKGNRWNEVIVR